MEVHKHPHHITHKKKWPEYLLEFLMLFLAVYLGFLAENFREHSVERHREKEYMRSLVNDLKTDTTNLGKNIQRYGALIKSQDTLLQTYSQLDRGYSKMFFRNMDGIAGFPDFIYTDATIQQLKNAGNFRLIQNQKIIERIMAYDAVVRSALINEQALGETLTNTDQHGIEMFNSQGLDAQKQTGKMPDQLEKEKFNILLTHDKLPLTRFYNQIRYHHRLTAIVRTNMADVKKSSVSLMGFIEKEYKLD